jgi:hypothetical protein
VLRVGLSNTDEEKQVLIPFVKEIVPIVVRFGDACSANKTNKRISRQEIQRASEAKAKE